jgi:hypothetical protein
MYYYIITGQIRSTTASNLRSSIPKKWEYVDEDPATLLQFLTKFELIIGRDMATLHEIKICGDVNGDLLTAASRVAERGRDTNGARAVGGVHRLG